MLILYGLVASGQTRMRKIDGYEKIAEVLIEKKLAKTG